MSGFAQSRRALLGAGFLFLVQAAHAADVSWATNSNAFFENPFAWNGGFVPGATDRPVFAAPYSGYTVSFSSDPFTAGILVQQSAATLDLQDHTYNYDGFLEVTNGGSLTWRNGLVLGSNSVFIGGTGPLSSMTVGQSASVAVPSVFVGRLSPGLLNVQTGGFLETSLLQTGYVSNQEGRVVIDGGRANAERTFLGGSETCVPFCNVGVGPGRLEIINGGRFTTGTLSLAKNGNAQVTIGSQGILEASSITLSQLGTASIVVDGATLRGGNTVIEASQASSVISSGSIEIKGGSNAEFNSVQIGPSGYSPMSTINADRRLTIGGAGTQVIIGGGLDVKGGGSRMTVSDGAFLRSASALIAGSNNVIAEATISNGGYWQNLGNLETGKFSTAGSRLTIDGGRVNTGSLYFASSSVCVPFCNVGPHSDLFVRNHGVLQTGAFFLGRLADTDMRVEGGSQVYSSSLAAGGGFAPVDIFVNGPETFWLNNGDVSLGIGGEQPAATTLLQLENGAQFRTGGALHTTSQSTVRIQSGGTLEIGTFGTFAGTLDFQSGELITHGNLAIQAGAPLGSNLMLGAGRSLRVGGTTTIGTGETLTLAGGRLFTGSLLPQGAFTFSSGVFGLTLADLDIGDGGLLGASVALTDARRIETSRVNVTGAGVLNVSGDALKASAIFNQGTIQLGGGVSRITTPILENIGRVQGTGTIKGDVDNQSTGQIRVITGQELDIAGSVKNSGQVLILGGTVQIDGALDNQQSGFVSGRGVLATGSVQNVGALAFSGTTDLIGSVRNEKDGTIVISGNSTLTFYHDVVHNGAEIRASVGSNVVFFGSVQGSGKFTGGGDFFFEGGLRPGNSPAITDITGNVTLGPGPLEIEIAGLIPGSEYDAVHVSGALTLRGGTLDVIFLDGFAAGSGDTFDILDFASLSGAFSALDLPALGGGLYWDSSNLYTTGVLSVQAVPEPATLSLLIGGLLLLVGARARFRHADPNNRT
jgi:hypothetical protein